MANATYQPGVYRSSGGDQLEIVSSGRIAIDSGGEIDVLSGGRLEIAGTAFITSGGALVLTTAIAKGNIATTGTVVANSGVTSTGTGTFNAVTSTGTGTFNAVTSTGTGTFNAVTSTGTGTFNAVSSTGTVTADQITTTGGVNRAISGGQVTALTGFIYPNEALTSASTAIAGYGISFLSASTALTIQLGAPIAGMDKWITVQTTAATVTITSTSLAAPADIGGSTQIAITTGTLLAPSWIHLVGRNSTSWRILGFGSNVSIT